MGLRGTVMPLEGIAPQVFEAIYQRQQGEILWVTVLWMIAQLNGYWVGGASPPWSPRTSIARVRR